MELAPIERTDDSGSALAGGVLPPPACSGRPKRRTLPFDRSAAWIPTRDALPATSHCPPAVARCAHSGVSAMLPTAAPASPKNSRLDVTGCIGILGRI